MASHRLLALNHEGRPVAFDTWNDDLQLYLLSDIKDSASLFDHVSGVAPAPPATADSGTRSQWLSRDATARLAIRNHLPVAECTHFGQHRTAQALYDAVVARYSSPATAALRRLLLPYLFPELSAFAIVADLVTHLRTSDAHYRATVPAEFLPTNQPPMFITLYFIHLLAAETSAVAVGAARGTPRPPFIEGCSPSPLSPYITSTTAADVSVTKDVGAASTSAKRRNSKGKGGRGGGGGSGGGDGGSGSGGGGSGGGGRGSGGGGGGGTGGGSGGSGGGSGGSGGSDGSGGATVAAASERDPVAPVAPDGEFSSDLLREFCRGEGILQSFTLPDSPQKNGIAERRIGLVMEVARTSMIHAAAPHFLWPFAVQYAAHQLNLWPRVSLPETSPTLRWTGKVVDASLLWVLGSCAVVRDTSADKLVARAIPCVFLGFVPDAPGWQLYHPTSRHVLPSHDVTFDESVPFYRLFPYRSAPPPPPPLFLAPGPPPVDPLPPQGPAPSGVSQVDPLPGTAPVQVAVGSGAAPGAASEGAAFGGAEPRGAGSEGAGSGGAEPEGVGLSMDLSASWSLSQLDSSSLPAVPDPASDLACAASPTVSRLLATAVTDPSFESAAASALIVELLDFATTSRLDYATALVAGSVSVSPPSVEGECALGTDILENRQEDFECLVAALPRFASMLLAPEGDPDAPDIPTPRSYAEAITGPYSSQWQAAMDAEMASWKSTGTYVDEVPPPGANIIDGMWIFRVKRPPGSPLAFKARYVARGFSQRQGFDYFQTFSPTPKMTTVWVLLHIAAQRDYELPSLDFSTTFLQGSLHEEIWLRRPPGFTGTTTLAALGFAPSTADPSLFLRTDTLLLPFYVFVYIDDLVFATADTEALILVKSELQKRHTCFDLGELRSYLGLQITRDRARRTITLTWCTRSFSASASSSPRHSPLLCLPATCSQLHLRTSPHRKVHRDAAKRVLRYLCSTSGMGLVLGGRGPVVLTGHADACWVDDSATLRSSQGYTFSLGSGSVFWRSTRSSSVLSSSCEAEIYAGAMAAQELRWLTYLLTNLGEQPRSPPLRLAYVATRANTADVFTKALPPGTCTSTPAGGRGGSGGGQQRQQRPPETLSPQQLRVWTVRWGSPGGGAWGTSAGDVEAPCRVEAASLGAFDSASTGAEPKEALHTFLPESGASRCFFRDCTTVTPLSTPVRVTLADPSGGPVVARSSTVLPCPAVPSGSLTGLHLPSFARNLVVTDVLQDQSVTVTQPEGELMAMCTNSHTGEHLAMFTRRPGSGLYTLTTKSAQVAESGQVAASVEVVVSCSCRLLTHPALLWHHRLGHPSHLRLRSMHSRLLVFGLPRSLPPLPRLFVPPCLPCVEGRQRAAPHFSFPPTTAPLQTLHMDDLPVLWLHSDRGGEFSSRLLEDFCGAEGITRSFTLQASPQQNGISECCIGLVMEVARTSLVHATAPHFLWPFAVRYTAEKLDLWPRVSHPETSPTLRWTGEFVPGYPTHLPPWFSPPPPPPVAPLPPQGPAPSGVSQVDPSPFVEPLEVSSDISGPTVGGDPTTDDIVAPRRSARTAAPPGFPPRLSSPPPQLVTVDSGARGGGDTGGADSGSASSRGAKFPTGIGGAGGAAARGTAVGGAGGAGASGSGPRRRETLSQERLHEWAVRWASPGGGAGLSGAGGASAGGTGARQQETLLRERLCEWAVRWGSPGGGAGRAGTAGAGHSCTGAGGPYGPVSRGSGGATTQPQSSALHHLPSLPPAATEFPVAGTTPLLFPPTDQSPPQLVPDSPWPAPAPYTDVTDSLTETREPVSGASTPVRARCVARPRAPAVPGTHRMALQSESDCPPSIGGELALGSDVIEDRQCELKCLATVLPHLASMLLCPEAYPDALDIPTTRTYAHAITSEYSSQWQTTMDTEMASSKSTGTYVNAVPPPEANIVDCMWIFIVEWPTGSPPAFKARYVSRGFSQRQGVDFFHTFSPTPKMTTPRVLLHVAAQMTLAALGFAPLTADPSLFLRTDPTLPPFYILVYVDDLVFATADIEALTLVKAELQKRHTCTDLGKPRSYLDLQIIRDRARRTITVTQSHMVHQVLQCFGFEFSLLQSIFLPTGHSLSAPPSDEFVEPSGQYPELVGFLICEAEIYAGSMAAQELRWLTYLLTDLGEWPRSPPVLYVDNKAMIALYREQRPEHRTKHISLRYFLARDLQQRG
ncbi:unnamed protein product [Closterium sp. NIES-53]